MDAWSQLRTFLRALTRPPSEQQLLRAVATLERASSPELSSFKEAAARRFPLARAFKTPEEVNALDERLEAEKNGEDETKEEAE